MITIDTKTKIIGLLGYPLTHSFSPVMQNSAFEKADLNNIYIPIEVIADDLGHVVQGISKMNFGGFNVTIPYKIKIIKYLDEIDKLARIIGAVNVVTIEDGQMKGYNTDGSGFLRSFEIETGETTEGKTILIIGSGGAARAISMTLAMNGAKKIYICNRTLERAVVLAEDINNSIKKCAFPVALLSRDLNDALRDTDIIINTSSIGMYPDVDVMPLDRGLLEKKFIVCDIVYNPYRTKLLEEAENIGCRTLSGIHMLVYQGAESFRLWTGKEPPVKTMFDAISEILTK